MAVLMAAGRLVEVETEVAGPPAAAARPAADFWVAAAVLVACPWVAVVDSWVLWDCWCRMRPWRLQEAMVGAA